MARERIAIAGAGIGGLAAALSLARRGFQVAVFEKAPGLDDAGAGIQLSPNAIKVLRNLGLGPNLADWMIEPEAIAIRRASDAAEIVRLPLGIAPERWGAPYGVIHRAHLQRILYEAALHHEGISLTLDARVARLENGEDEVTLTVARGAVATTDRVDVMVGADGIRSMAALAAGGGDLRFAGRRAWRAVLPLGQGPSWLKANVSTLWLGRNAHVVHYPVGDGDRLNVVVVTRDDDPGEGWSQPRSAADLAPHLAGWCAPIRELLAMQAEWRSWPLYERPVEAMAKGRIALLGDAAHAMLPFLAQGGAMAIEDGFELAEHLDHGRGLVPHRLEAYSDSRSRRVRRVQEESRRNGERYHWGWPRNAARDAGLRLIGGAALLARYDWLYGWQPPSLPHNPAAA